MSIYLGIDPGVGGGIAAVSENNGFEFAVRMPETERDILTVLQQTDRFNEAFAILEFVRSSPAMGVVSAFSFGRGYGGLRMALVACGIPFDEVVPRKWQGVMQCLSRGDKNVTKRRAQELFPTVKVTHAIADALLLAEYARRINSRAVPEGDRPRFIDPMDALRNRAETLGRTFQK